MIDFKEFLCIIGQNKKSTSRKDKRTGKENDQLRIYHMIVERKPKETNKNRNDNAVSGK